MPGGRSHTTHRWLLQKHGQPPWSLPSLPISQLWKFETIGGEAAFVFAQTPSAGVE